MWHVPGNEDDEDSHFVKVLLSYARRRRCKSRTTLLLFFKRYTDRRKNVISVRDNQSSFSKRLDQYSRDFTKAVKTLHENS
jgi:hypothetical protein